MKKRLTKKIISMGLTGTLLLAGATPAMATNPSYEIQNIAETTQATKSVSNSSYAFSYAVNSSRTAITITGLPTDYSGALVIPSTIDGLPVTSIGDDAFASCKSLISLSIPNSVTTIGSFAFSGCENLKSVTIGNSLTTINKYAFSSCSSLTSVKIPDSVTTIGSNAFDGCWGLTSITIPDSVTSLGDHAFYDCTSLNAVTIGDSLTSIASSTFFGCESLTSVNFGERVTSIGSYAFSECTSLTSITIPASVKGIGYMVFNGCTSLTSIKVLGSLTGVGSLRDFSYKTNEDGTGIEITDLPTDYSGALVIPNTIDGLPVTSIGTSAFFDCCGLTSITIPNSVELIGRSAFNGCTSLTSFTVPDSLTTIGSYAFTDCTSLTSLSISASVTRIADWTFLGCKNLTSVEIGDSVTSIDAYAFLECTNLTSITIPDSVTNIDSSVFTDCDNLIIYCNEGSFAQTYAQNNNIPFQIIKNISKEYAMKLESTKAYNNGVLEDTNESIINGVAYKAKLQFNNFKTFLPARSVAQAIGLTVGYDASTSATTISNSTKTVKIIPNSTNIIVVENGKSTIINTGVAPIYVKGVIHIPVKAVIEQFDFFVNWHGDGYLLITDYELASNKIDTLKAKVAKVL